VLPAQPQPHLSAQSHLSLTACSYLSLCALAGKTIREAHTNVKSGKATVGQKTIVKKMDKGRANGRACSQPNPSPI
jgi:hypothetical protein